MANSVTRNRSAPYGRSCTECAKAKCRCMVREGSSCERCHRLSKPCTPSARTRRRSSGNITRRSNLEDKLDDLVTLLRNQNTTLQHSNIATSSEIASLPTPFSALSPLPSNNDARLTAKNIIDFRSHLHYFPFMVLTDITTAESLTLTHPITAQAIRTLCTKALRLQTPLAKELRSAIATQVIVNGERSMDLLWGVVMCIAWSKYITHGKQFLGSMCSLARTLISDLRLDRPTHPAWCPSGGPAAESTHKRTKEGSRILIAVFVLSAGISATFKGDIMPWSIQIDEACELLRKEGDESDSTLIAMALLARVTVSAADVARGVLDDDGAGRYATSAIAPLRISFEQAKATLTPEQLQHSSILAYLHTAEISMLELAFHTPRTPSGNRVLGSSQNIELSRIANLHALLQSCTSCISLFLNIDMALMTTTCMLVYSYSLRLLYRLSTPKDVVPGWDPQIARDTMGIGACIEQAAQKAETTNARLRVEIGEDTMFAVAAEIMRATAGNWRFPGELDTNAAGDDAAGWSTAVDEVLDISGFDFSDDSWVSSFNF